METFDDIKEFDVNECVSITCIEKLESIDTDFDCNYCIGETMEMALVQWISSSDMKKLISTLQTLGWLILHQSFKSLTC